MSKQNDIIHEENAALNNENGVASEVSERKKKFIEPAISAPIDVLEATTFFQAATSGVTN